MMVITNGKLILRDQIVEGLAVVCSDRIVDIVSEDEIPEGAMIVDAEGGYIAPGLIDLHIHGFLGMDVCDGDENAIRTMAKGLLAGGVTGFLPTTMTVDMKVIRRAFEVCRALREESRSWQGSAILGCHAEGPFISEGKKGAQDPAYILPPDAAFVKEYADIIKIITLAPEVDGDDFSVIRKICRDTDVVVSMGHTMADYETAIGSVGAGVRHVTHLFNAMTPLSHRAPGVVGAALHSDVSCELIADMFHVDKSLYDLLWKLKGRRLCLVTDCLSAGGLPHGEYTLGGARILYHDNVCRLVDGTVAGSVLRLNEGVRNVYENSNIPLHECVNCASLNPATVIGVADRKGSIEIGKDADIIITDERFEVKKSIIGGKIQYEA